MYKVFIYDKPVFITKKALLNNNLKQYDKAFSTQEIITYLALQNSEGVEIITDKPKETWKVFKSFFKYVIAAGGVVYNENNEVLLIYRLDKWDLPKGKLEKNEEVDTCAIREVEEECNVTGLYITKELESTFHCYQTRKGKWALKRTYWYNMKTAYAGKLVPQTEEGIQKVEWVDKIKLAEVKKDTYNSLLAVFDTIELK